MVERVFALHRQLSLWIEGITCVQIHTNVWSCVKMFEVSLCWTIFIWVDLSHLDTFSLMQGATVQHMHLHLLWCTCCNERVLCFFTSHEIKPMETYFADSLIFTDNLLCSDFLFHTKFLQKEWISIWTLCYRVRIWYKIVWCPYSDIHTLPSSIHECQFFC